MDPLKAYNYSDDYSDRVSELLIIKLQVRVLNCLWLNQQGHIFTGYFFVNKSQPKYQTCVFVKEMYFVSVHV